MYKWICDGEITNWPIDILSEEFFEDNRDLWPDSYLMYVAM